MTKLPAIKFLPLVILLISQVALSTETGNQFFYHDGLNGVPDPYGSGLAVCSARQALIN